MTYNEIESIANCLWDEAKSMPHEELRSEVEPWVVEPSNTVGRVVAYEILFMLYWVNMNMIVHSSLSVASK